MAKANSDKVKFLESRTVNNPDGEDQEFVAGKTYDMNPASAFRWVRRGVAEYVSTSNSRSDANNSSND